LQSVLVKQVASVFVREAAYGDQLEPSSVVARGVGRELVRVESEQRSRSSVSVAEQVRSVAAQRGGIVDERRGIAPEPQRLFRVFERDGCPQLLDPLG
jgi:hypothetical protein